MFRCFILCCAKLSQPLKGALDGIKEKYYIVSSKALGFHKDEQLVG